MTELLRLEETTRVAELCPVAEDGVATVPDVLGEAPELDGFEDVTDADAVTPEENDAVEVMELDKVDDKEPTELDALGTDEVLDTLMPELDNVEDLTEVVNPEVKTDPEDAEPVAEPELRLGERKEELPESLVAELVWAEEL